MNEDNFKLALLSIRELRAEQNRTQQGLRRMQKTTVGMNQALGQTQQAMRQTQQAMRQMQKAMEQMQTTMSTLQQSVSESNSALEDVCESQSVMGDKLDTVIVVLERMGENSVSTQKRLASIEERLDRLEDAS